MLLASTITLHALLYTNKLRYIEQSILNKEETQSEMGCDGEKPSLKKFVLATSGISDVMTIPLLVDMIPNE